MHIRHTPKYSQIHRPVYRMSMGGFGCCRCRSVIGPPAMLAATMASRYIDLMAAQPRAVEPAALTGWRVVSQAGVVLCDGMPAAPVLSAIATACYEVSDSHSMAPGSVLAVWSKWEARARYGCGSAVGCSA